MLLCNGMQCVRDGCLVGHRSSLECSMLESMELFCRFRSSSFGFGDLGLMIQNCEI
ncbi:unnamed protein product [Musa acuminata subsp. burmannicoides]